MANNPAEVEKTITDISNAWTTLAPAATFAGMTASSTFKSSALASCAAGAAPDECVEQIDIGGPAMVRAAAKNHARVAVVTDPSMYSAVADALAWFGAEGYLG